MDLDTPVHPDSETLRTSGSSTPTDPANRTAENQDPSTGNLFQQLLIQYIQMQIRNDTIMTQMIRRLLNLEGTSLIKDPIVNYGHKIPVPKWIRDMSFEAWKQKILNFKEQSLMNENQKLILILESLKKLRRDRNSKIG